MLGRLCVAWFLCCGSASAASIAWEPAKSADSCADARTFQRDLEARLGRSLAEVPDAPQVLRITIDRAGKTFIAHIELRNSQSTLVGERTLSVQGERCEAIEPYLSLAVALMIDPEADLGEPEKHAEPPANDSFPGGPAVPPAPVPPAVAATPPPAPVESPVARISGRGRHVVYVYPALRDNADASQAHSAASVALSVLAQRLFGRRLVERELYTVVEPPALFQDALSAESFRRGAFDTAPPKAFSAPDVLAPEPEYVLQPLVTSLTVQDGLDYSRGSQLPLVTVTLRLGLAGIDYVRREELEPLDATETVSVEGNRHDARAVGFAVRLALGKAVESLLGALRREGAFRIRPRWEAEANAMVLGSLRSVEAGDRFQFEDASGARSGWAVARDVEANRARLQIWKSCTGERLVDVGKQQRGTFEVSLRRVQHLADRDASDADRVRAMAGSRSTRALGSVSEYGIDWRYYIEPPSGSGLRPFAASNLSFLKSDEVAIGISTQGGLGYEFSVLPTIGLSLMPFASLGPTLIEGKLGTNSELNSPLSNVVGLVGSAGVRLELYRLFGALSLSASAQFQYVAALYSETPREQYLDDRYPNLNSFVLQLGGAYRPSDYPD